MDQRPSRPRPSSRRRNTCSLATWTRHRTVSSTRHLLTLQGYLSALAQEAEAQLDLGRVVVREMVRQARALTDEECRPSRKSARHAAQTARDLLALLTREGWGTASTAESEEPLRA